MRNFGNCIIKVTFGNYIINLSYFPGPEAFSSYMLDFLGNFAVSEKDIDDELIILDLMFYNDTLRLRGLFLFPYVDKSSTFYDIYSCDLNSNNINLQIHII